MVQYIIELTEETLRATEPLSDLKRWSELLTTLFDEIDRLDPSDFLPAERTKFVIARMTARRYAYPATALQARDKDGVLGMLSKVRAALDGFGGDGSRIVTRSFAFMKDAGLKQIVERDYRELWLSVYPGRAWKSTVVLAGSILEAIHFDQLASDPAVKAKAEASSKAPLDSKKVFIDVASGNWKLVKLIDVAVDIGVLPADRAKSIDQVLRDYRNFVHPKKEIKSAHPCTEAEAMMSMGALEGLCNVLK